MANDAHCREEVTPGSLMALIRRVRAFCELKDAELRSETGLTEAQFAFLREMPLAGTIRTGDLARRGGLSPSRGGRVVDELVREGLLRRHAAANDRRVQVLALTPRGRAVRERIGDLVCRCEDLLWERLDATDLEKVMGGLRALVDVIEVK